MLYSKNTDGFRIAYERHGKGDAVVLLHGWPGDRTDYAPMVPLLRDFADVVVPDLRGFGESDKHLIDPKLAYSSEAQARGIIGLMEELSLGPAIFVGYDIGSHVSQAVTKLRPDLVRALVVSPPVPGAGKRILELKEAKEFWYSTFHQLSIPEKIIDGKPEAIEAYIRYFLDYWSGPNFVIDEGHLAHLVKVYSAPGAFTASLGWHRSSDPVTYFANEQPPAKDQRIKTPVTVLWQEFDPIFPTHWADRLDEFFVDVELRFLKGSGHFTPLEATAEFAKAIRERLSTAL